MKTIAWAIVFFLSGGTTIAGQQSANPPSLTSITTSPESSKLFAGKPFTFTLIGTNFDPNHAHVLFNGPGCSPCNVPTELLRNKSSTELQGSATVPSSGNYTISVQNGNDPNLVSNSRSLTFGNATPPTGISGSSSAPTIFNIDKDFCSDRGGYRYEATPGTKTSKITSLPGDLLVGVTDPIPNLNKFVDPGKAILSTTSETKLQPNGSDASRLLVRAFGAGPCDEGKATQVSVSFRLLGIVYYVINIVRWQKVKTPSSGDQQPYLIASNDWYLFNTQDSSLLRQTPFHGKFLPELTAKTRIYGSDSVGFLAVHVRESDIPQADFKKLQITYDVTVKQTTPINVQHLETLIGIITGIELGGTPKAPAAAAGEIPTTAIGLYGGGQLSNIEKLPDDITFAVTIKFPPSSASPTSTAGQPRPATFNKTYHDEGLQHWDVSVGVPVNSIKELNYSSTDGIVTSKEVSRYNAYGLFDVYPWPIDISDPPPLAYPHVVVGLPFSGKVFNKPFLGAGGVIGFQSLPWIGKFLNTTIPMRLNFYGGVVYNKEFRPATLKVGNPGSPAAVANDLRGVRVWKGQFGIELSIKDVAGKLKSKSGSGSSGGTKGGG